MAEIRIPLDNLPPPDSNGDHFFQFRIISVDKNQWSAWSQLYEIKSIGQFRPLPSAYTVSPVSGTEAFINLAWDTPEVYNYADSLASAALDHGHSQEVHYADVFAKWSGEDFYYHDRVAIDAISIMKKDGETSLRVVVLSPIKNIPHHEPYEEEIDFQNRLDEFLGAPVDFVLPDPIPEAVPGAAYSLFKILDTGTMSLI